MIQPEGSCVLVLTLAAVAGDGIGAVPVCIPAAADAAGAAAAAAVAEPQADLCFQGPAALGRAPFLGFRGIFPRAQLFTSPLPHV